MFNDLHDKGNEIEQLWPPRSKRSTCRKLLGRGLRLLRQARHSGSGVGNSPPEQGECLGMCGHTKNGIVFFEKNQGFRLFWLLNRMYHNFVTKPRAVFSEAA